MNSSDRMISDYPEYKASVWIWKICPPILITVGSIGNIMSIVVLTRKNMRKSSVSIYLIVLSVVDILVLYTGLLRQTIRYHVDVDIRELSPVMCKINTWLVYFTLDMSVWLLVAVTGERIVSVWFPYRVKFACTSITSCVVICVIGVVLLSVNSHFLYGVGDMKEEDVLYKCVSLWDDYNNFTVDVWPWIDLCFFCLVPFAILIIGNISIIVKVVSSKKNVRRLNTLVANTHQKEAYKRTSSMTVMLLCLNVVFLICTSPISVYLVGQSKWIENLDVHGEAEHALIWAVVNILMYTNNSMNFLLYCLSGTRFREELKNIFRKRNQVQPQLSLTNINGTRQPLADSELHVKQDHVSLPRISNPSRLPVVFESTSVEIPDEGTEPQNPQTDFGRISM